MNRSFSRFVFGGVAVCALAALTAATAQRAETPTGSPEATIDLATARQRTVAVQRHKDRGSRFSWAGTGGTAYWRASEDVRLCTPRR
jgi:hypothetical protein